MAVTVRFQQQYGNFCDSCGQKDNNVRLVNIAVGRISSTNPIFFCSTCLRTYTGFLETPVAYHSEQFMMTGTDILSWQDKTKARGSETPMGKLMEKMKGCFDESRKSLLEHKIVKGQYLRRALEHFDELYEEWKKR